MATYSVRIPNNYEFSNIYINIGSKQLVLPTIYINLGASVVSGDSISTAMENPNDPVSLTFNNVNSGMRGLGAFAGQSTINYDIDNTYKLQRVVSTPWLQGDVYRGSTRVDSIIFPPAVANGFRPTICVYNTYDNKIVMIFYSGDFSNGTYNASDLTFFPYYYGTYTANSYSAGGIWSVSASLKAIYDALSNNAILPPSDPYSGAGDSTTGGGDGTFDGSSDPVPVPSLPSVGATDTGFISLFVPSQSQLKQVASYLWSNFFDLATFKKIFEDPMDCILGLSVVPVSVPTSGNAQITVGNVELSGISLPLASQQYVELDCGTITFDRYFGSYLDFEPYTKMSLFVPYSGVHSVSADDIMGKTVGLKYHIDILTGSLVAFLTCGDSVLYEFNGACASNIPVNSMNYASTIENAIRIAVNIGTTVATAGAAAPAAGAVEAGKVAAGGAGIGRGIAIAGSTAEGALSLKPSIDRAGSLGGTTGLMGNQIPYFIITRPRMCKPKNQDFFQGYPSFIQTVLGDMDGTGFTAFENVILAETYLTETEKAELSSILSAGVYL